MDGTLASLHRYPITGLNGIDLSSVEVLPGSGLPFDRYMALTWNDGQFDVAKPADRFFRDRRQMRLGVGFDPRSQMLQVRVRDRIAHEANLSSPQGMAETAAFFSRMYGEELVLVRAEAAPFTDKPISLINLDTVAAFADRIGVEVNPVRFRSNVYFSGWPAWSEMDLPPGTELMIGDVRFRVICRIERCNVTTWNPKTAEIDLLVPQLIRQHYGHAELGIRVEPVQAGTIHSNDRITLA